MSKQSEMKTNMFSTLLWLILLFWWRETLRPFWKSKWPSRYKSAWPSVTVTFEGYFHDHIMSLSEGLMDCELLSWCRVIIWLTIRETEVSMRHTNTRTHSSTKLLNAICVSWCCFSNVRKYKCHKCKLCLDLFIL